MSKQNPKPPNKPSLWLDMKHFPDGTEAPDQKLTENELFRACGVTWEVPRGTTYSVGL